MKVALMAALALSCGDKDDTQAPDDTQAEPMDWSLADLGGACETADHVGWFELAQWEDEPDLEFSTVTGTVQDAVIPTTILFEEQVEGQCTLWRKINPYCEDACDSDQVCTHDGECVPWPQQLDVGTVRVEGMLQDLAMEPDGFNNYWDTNVSHPLFEPGAPIRLTSDNGITLRGLGVDALVVAETAWHIVRGQDLELAWTAGEAEATVLLSFNVDQHGNSPITMRCEVPDTGSYAVPGSILEALLDYGVSGYASGWMRRLTADKTSTEHGCVDLQVYSHVGTDLTVEGHTACTWDGDCPDGQRCDLETNTCVDD